MRKYHELTYLENHNVKSIFFPPEISDLTIKHTQILTTKLVR